MLPLLLFSSVNDINICFFHRIKSWGCVSHLLGIWPIFKLKKGLWLGYIFYKFVELPPKIVVKLNFAQFSGSLLYTVDEIHNKR